MSTMTVSLDLPRDLVGALDVPEIGVGSRLKELIAVELFREGVISSGKGAELTGTSKGEFIDLLGRQGILYFTQSPEELTGEVATLERLLGEGNR